MKTWCISVIPSTIRAFIVVKKTTYVNDVYAQRKYAQQPVPSVVPVGLSKALTAIQKLCEEANQWLNPNPYARPNDNP